MYRCCVSLSVCNDQACLNQQRHRAKAPPLRACEIKATDRAEAPAKQMPRGQAFLRRLERAGQARDVVFLDMDALVIAPMAPAFAPEAAASAPFDLALTLSDAVDMCAAQRGPSCTCPASACDRLCNKRHGHAACGTSWAQDCLLGPAVRMHAVRLHRGGRPWYARAAPSLCGRREGQGLLLGARAQRCACRAAGRSTWACSWCRAGATRRPLPCSTRSATSTPSTSRSSPGRCCPGELARVGGGLASGRQRVPDAGANVTVPMLWPPAVPSKPQSLRACARRCGPLL